RRFGGGVILESQGCEDDQAKRGQAHRESPPVQPLAPHTILPPSRESGYDHARQVLALCELLEAVAQELERLATPTATPR
ncbi:MAG: hypothetical protein ACERNK_19050, partial [Deltaproteobacteria bacterium]